MGAQALAAQVDAFALVVAAVASERVRVRAFQGDTVGPQLLLCVARAVCGGLLGAMVGNLRDDPREVPACGLLHVVDDRCQPVVVLLARHASVALALVPKERAEPTGTELPVPPKGPAKSSSALLQLVDLVAAVPGAADTD